MPACLRALFLAFLLCLADTFGAQALQAVPPLGGRVVDRTATLTPEQRSRLEAKLADFDRDKGVQIVILIVPTVAPETSAEFALRVVEKWKLGRNGVDDGALLLVARNDRKLRIESGYGLEGTLNDATARRIIGETIGPRLAQSDFYGGIDAGVDAMMRVIAGEALPPPCQKSAQGGPQAAGGFDSESLLGLGFVLVFVVVGVLRAIFGRLLASMVIGGVAGVLATLLLGSLWLAVVI